MTLEEQIIYSKNVIFRLLKHPEKRDIISPPERYDELVRIAKILMLYDGYMYNLRELRYPTMGDYFTMDLRRGRRYEKELRKDIGRVFEGNIVALDSLLFYKVLNDARHVLDGTIKGTGLESKLDLADWMGRAYTLDDLRERWRELMGDRRLNPRIKEFFQLLDSYDSRITEALDYALFLKGLFPKPLEPGTVENWDVYKEGIKKALRYLEEVILYTEVINREFLPEDVNSIYQNLFLFNTHFPDYKVSPLEALNKVVYYLFDGIKKKLGENLSLLEAYIVARYNPARKNGYYIIENRIDFIDGSALIDTVKVPIYSKRQNIGRRKALEILRKAGYENLT